MKQTLGHFRTDIYESDPGEDQQILERLYATIFSLFLTARCRLLERVHSNFQLLGRMCRMPGKNMLKVF